MTQLLAGLTLDRTINTPLAHQLADHIQAAITAGRVPVGTWLENEKAVARRLGLSIPTVRQAVARLIAEGLVARQRGVGTRIVNDRVHRPPTITSLFDELARAGEEPTTRVLALRRVTPDEDLSVAFASKEPL
ncbi:MAG: GntR family transcriptional regulator, partial [Bifidobacteriaceae bacterium]|nr:GntR family transcriptional regulator [Bifidobacteriaceae bacterium]